ncbi:MAG: YbbR-like domain-containing protein [Candidatus Omnitrophota bacterium]|nr:MAG: YbbR-like domain-containing protein [Candidatus Omnitrophota bacterium]
MKLKKILLNNIGLKLLALFLAFVTWFYIGEASKAVSQKTVLQKIFTSAYYSSKKLYVKPIFVGSVPGGYEFVKRDVNVVPEFIVVLGPSNILSKKEFIYTKAIDLSKHTKSRTIDIELRSISPSIKLQKTNAQVYLPIKKLGKNTKE